MTNELLWTLGGDPIEYRLSKFDLISEIDALLETLRVLSMPVNRACRIYEARNLLEQLKNGVISTNSKSQQTLFDAAIATLSDAFQLGAIATHCETSNDPAFVQKATALLKDSVGAPGRLGIPTPGRDVQFELFANACLNATGVRATIGSPPEPDIMITTSIMSFGAEAKRVKSGKRLKERAKKASKQLRTCPLGGIFLTDLSQIFSGVGVFVSTQDALADLEKRLFKYMYGHLADIRNVTSAKSCFAWTAYAQAPYFAEGGLPGQVFQWKTFNLCHEHDPRWLHLVEITSILSRFASR